MKASDDFRDQPVAEVLAALGTDPKQGLGGTEAASRLEALGPNEIAVREEPLWHRVLRRFWGPIPRIIDGARTVRIFHEDIPVNAEVHTIGGFSAHADCDELLAWWSAGPRPEQTVLVHGEEDAMRHFAGRLPEDAAVLQPTLHTELAL